MGVSLDPQQQQAYQDDGVLFPLTAVTASEASVACGHALDFLERQGPYARAVDSSQVHLFLPWAFDLVTDSRVLDAVEGVLGPNIIGWATTLFAKPPGHLAPGRNLLGAGFDSGDNRLDRFDRQ